MNPRVPLRLKIIVAVVALFIISPLNILGDIPLLGMFDDIALLGFLADWFVKATAAYAPADPAAGPFGESIEPTRPPLSWPRNQ